MPSRNPRALPPDLEPRAMPDHIAIVMDGNGRWAGERGLPRNKGHEAGETALFDTVEGALDVGESLLVRRSNELHDRNVRIRFIGRRDRVPPHVRRRIREAEELTAGDTQMTLAVALDYGGRDELTRAVRELVSEARAGQGPKRIDERAISARLDAPDMPDVDLLIRTAGERRLSNFLLWQLYYAEVYFTPLRWPDFNRHELFNALRDYQGRHRRFGAVPTREPAAGAPS